MRSIRILKQFFKTFRWKIKIPDDIFNFRNLYFNRSF